MIAADPATGRDEKKRASAGLGGGGAEAGGRRSRASARGGSSWCSYNGAVSGSEGQREARKNKGSVPFGVGSHTAVRREARGRARGAMNGGNDGGGGRQEPRGDRRTVW